MSDAASRSFGVLTHSVLISTLCGSSVMSSILQMRKLRRGVKGLAREAPDGEQQSPLGP